ncbi:MAG: 2-isopropylmalate synthase [bacterium ADurb.Bin400]|nr:MAG: 2-isopropylmalate synthase [bacterium ADurb.Bin400]
MNLHEKLEVARQLARLNVDVIEAGFPVSSQGDFDAVRAIASEISGPTICGLARCLEKDIVAAANALAPAPKHRIHVFCATSKIHLEHKLRKAHAEIIRMSVTGVKMAKNFTKDVEFSPEDASRTEREFLVDVVTAAIEAGATTINIPDTVGYAIPWEYGELIRYLKDNVPNINQAVISVHCHNDLGLAVANSLAAIAAGADQVECTLNGIGERAGNAALEEIVMAIRTRQDHFSGITTGINTREIYRSSRLLTDVTGATVQPNKAIVGANAFRHESGIHQHGVLQERTTYEIMDPDTVGVPRHQLVLGKHSGRHAFVERLKELGYDLSTSEVEQAFSQFKELADKKKEVFDADLEAIVAGKDRATNGHFKLEYFHAMSGTSIKPTATIRISRSGKSSTEVEVGDGQIDAVFQAIAKVADINHELVDFSVTSATPGADALGHVVVRIRNGKKDRIFTGRGISTDTIEASALAYVQALNQLMISQTD